MPTDYDMIDASVDFLLAEARRNRKEFFRSKSVRDRRKIKQTCSHLLARARQEKIELEKFA